MQRLDQSAASSIASAIVAHPGDRRGEADRRRTPQDQKAIKTPLAEGLLSIGVITRYATLLSGSRGTHPLAIVGLDASPRTVSARLMGRAPASPSPPARSARWRTTARARRLGTEPPRDHRRAPW